MSVIIKTEELTRTIDRFKGADWYETINRFKINILGCGGIGSWAALALSSVVNNMELIDDDIIEIHNIGGQNFSFYDIGFYKTESTANKLYQMSPNCNISIISKRLNENTDFFNYEESITISAVDNMKARKMLFNNFLNRACENSLFIDGRMEAELFQIFCVPYKDKEKIERYKQTLFNDEDLEDAPCNYKATRYVGMMIGSLIQQLAVNHAANLSHKFDIKELPFKIRYVGPMLDYSVEN